MDLVKWAGKRWKRTGRHAVGLCALLPLLLTSFLVLPPQAALADPAGVTVQRYYATWENEWSTSSITYVDIEPATGYKPLTLSFTPPATADYLLITGFSFTNSSTMYTTSVQLLMNGAQVFFRTCNPSSVTDYLTSGFTTVYSLTGGTPYTFQMQMMTNNALGAARMRDASIMLFKISNYYYASDDTLRTYTTGTYTTDSA